MKKYLLQTDLSSENRCLVAGGLAGAFGLIFYNPIEVLKVRA